MSELATTQGRAHALEKLAERRAANKDRKPFRNEELHAGSPVFLPCIACGDLIMHSETYIYRIELCAECSAMHALGWLE